MHPTMVPAETARADEFNKLAENGGWPILCDAHCRFEEPKLGEMLAIWRGKTGVHGIPHRRDMTARLLQPYMPMISIYERVEAEDGSFRYRVRLMGTAVVQVTEEMSGKFLDKIIPEKFLPRWNALGETVLAHGAPLRFVNRADTFNKSYIVGESFVAPLLSDDGKTNLILTATDYDGVDSWIKVEAEVRKQLSLD